MRLLLHHASLHSMQPQRGTLLRTDFRRKMKSATPGDDEHWLAQYYRIPYVAHYIQKLAATERSTIHMEIHTVWLLALNINTKSGCSVQCNG